MLISDINTFALPLIVKHSVSFYAKLPFVEKTHKTVPQPYLYASITSVRPLLPFEIAL